MCSKKLWVPALVAAVCAVGFVRSGALADSADAAKSAAQPEMKLPPGWTMEDMQACMVAGSPGKMHELLSKDVGVWEGESTMWMAPGAEPVKSKSKATITPIMDGRYFKIETDSDIPGMGKSTGLQYCGFDNVSQKFVSTWMDSMSTGMMSGTGELSEDGKVLKWTFSGYCPLNKQPITMREVDTVTGPGKKKLEMWGPDPKTNKEYKMIVIEMTKTK